MLSSNYDLKKKSVYRAFNVIYGTCKVGRVASADVVFELLKTKCMPILLHGLDACPVSSHQILRIMLLYHVLGNFLMSILLKSLTLWPCVKTNLLRDTC